MSRILDIQGGTGVAAMRGEIGDIGVEVLNHIGHDGKNESGDGADPQIPGAGLVDGRGKRIGESHKHGVRGEAYFSKRRLMVGITALNMIFSCIDFNKFGSIDSGKEASLYIARYGLINGY
jgi:hypothetical protein